MNYGSSQNVYTLWMTMRCRKMKSLINASHLCQSGSQGLNCLQGPTRFALPFCPHLPPIPCSPTAQPLASLLFHKEPGVFPSRGLCTGCFHCLHHPFLTPFGSLLSREAFPDHLIKICILSLTFHILSLNCFSL